MKFFQRKTIFGCDAREDGESAYLTRFTVIECASWQLCIHVFHRSDADELHDHPWSFWTVPLWRGYMEQTPEGCQRIRPFTINFRPATWKHRVELLNGRPAITLVVMGRRVREWGFMTKLGWQHWRRYFRERGC